ncbi:MAG: hypothetical protein Q9220_006299 [cf. Caloplaca sp. 1 TL-2023]
MGSTAATRHFTEPTIGPGTKTNILESSARPIAGLVNQLTSTADSMDVRQGPAPVQIPADLAGIKGALVRKVNSALGIVNELTAVLEKCNRRQDTKAFEAATASLGQATSTLDSLVEEVELYKVEWNAALSGQSGQLKELKDEYRALTRLTKDEEIYLARLTQDAGSIRTTESEEIQLPTQVVHLEKCIDDLKKETSGLRAQKEALDTTVWGLLAMHNRPADSQVPRAHIEELNNNDRNMRALNESLKSRLSVAEKDRDRAQGEANEVRRLRDDLLIVRDQLNTTRQGYRSLEKDRDYYKGLYGTCNAELDAKSRRINLLSQELEDLQRQGRASTETDDFTNVSEHMQGRRKRPRTATQAKYSAARGAQRLGASSETGTAPTPGKAQTTSAQNPDQEAWFDVAEMRATEFRYGELPDGLFDRIKTQFGQWDQSRNDWYMGPKTIGLVKCANRWVGGHASNMEHGYACVDCIKRQLVCVAVCGGRVQLRCLPPDLRGDADGKEHMAYWVCHDDDSD